MNTQLQPIEHNNQRILTTQQIAEAYETNVSYINVNFHNNKDRYIPGKHYFLLEGEALRNFKDYLSNLKVVVGDRAPSLYLWTEKGALMHAKSLNTDKAWQAYEMLVDEYYRLKDNPLHGATVLESLETRFDSLLDQTQNIKFDLREIGNEIKRSKRMIAKHERQEHKPLAAPKLRPERPSLSDQEKVLEVLAKFKKQWANSYTISQAGSTHLRKIGSIEVRIILDQLVAEKIAVKVGKGKTALYRLV